MARTSPEVNGVEWKRGPLTEMHMTEEEEDVDRGRRACNLPGAERMEAGQAGKCGERWTGGRWRRGVNVEEMHVEESDENV